MQFQQQQQEHKGALQYGEGKKDGNFLEKEAELGLERELLTLPLWVQLLPSCSCPHTCACTHVVKAVQHNKHMHAGLWIFCGHPCTRRNMENTCT